VEDRQCKVVRDRKGERVFMPETRRYSGPSAALAHPQLGSAQQHRAAQLGHTAPGGGGGSGDAQSHVPMCLTQTRPEATQSSFEEGA